MATALSRIQPNQIHVEALFNKQMHRLRAYTDRIFIILMLCQWVVGTMLAIWLSPKTWIGATSNPHLHVWAAIVLGGLISAAPILLALRMPGSKLTRHTIAVSQMLWSALLIHITGGRIETHFHVFGSLAFLAFYRDWRVLLTATLVVAADHIVRGVYWPLSVFGVVNESPFRWVEHAAWVVFEDVILVIACLRGLGETREICSRQALLESTNEDIEQLVLDRTRELQYANEQLGDEINERHKAEARETRLGKIFDGCINEIYVFDRDSLRFLQANRGATDNLGYSEQEMLKLTPLDLKPTVDRETFQTLLKPLLNGEVDFVPFECYHRRKDGSMYPVDVHLQLSDWGDTPVFVAFVLDITERRIIELQRDQAQEKLVDASHRAGMAEIATGVLHNVGNVLNSVNVSTSLISEALTRSRVANLQRAAALLQVNNEELRAFFDSDKGRKFPQYLSTLSASLISERDLALEEIKHLSENVDHIKEIVQTQQAHARVGGIIEKLNPVTIVEEVLRMRSSSITRNQIEVVREYDEQLEIETDRHKLLQIVINLISNATNAIVESESTVDRLSLSVRRCEQSRVEIKVKDSGTGIEMNNLKKVFNHGFTTRKEGHGFGLHSCALAAKELGGSITVESEGLGKGATFVLTLPISGQGGHSSESNVPSSVSDSASLPAISNSVVAGSPS